jgi:hypothetical protein
MITSDMHTLLETNERRPIPQFSKYEIDTSGFIYRKGKCISSQLKSGRWYSVIYNNYNNQVIVDTKRLAEAIFKGDPPELTREDIEVHLKAITVPDFPRYAVAQHGAIYCMDPPRRGRHAGKRYLLREFVSSSNKKPYVTLYDYEGRRRNVQVEKVVHSAWGSTKTFPLDDE